VASKKSRHSFAPPPRIVKGRFVKRQINSATKAHLLRGAFYVLLLVAICVMPFALAQRVTIVRSTPSRGVPAPKLPYDLRPVPDLPASHLPKTLNPGGYCNVIVNGGFETGSFTGWTIDGFNNPPVVTNTFSHSGSFSAFAGGDPPTAFCGGGNEPTGDSSFYQQFTVPAGSSTLTFWHWECGTTSITFDWQDAYITDTNGNILQTIFHLAGNEQTWNQQTVDMTPYAGQTVRLKFLVHQDGFGDLTGMYVDDVFLLIPCGTPTPTPTATPCASIGSWAEQAPHPIAVSGHAVVSQGGNVYSFGGIVNNMAIVNAYKYSPATNTWTPIAPLLAPRGWFSAVSDGTYIYLLGGVDQNFNTTATLWRYDPASNTYNTSLPSYTIPTYFHASAYLNGKIYRIAGAAIGTDYHVEVYDIATNTWSMAANYPFANHNLMAAALGSYIYAGGGNASPDKTYRYDPNTDTWDDAAIADLPAGRSAAASDVYNGRWLLAGGDVNFATSNSVIAWDPATNTWSDLPNMIQPRDYLEGATAGGSFYAIAGNSGPGTPTNDNQQYTETTCGTPTPTPSPTPTPTITPTATPTPTSTPRVTPTPRVQPTPRPRPSPAPRPTR
jgi:Kelch motif